MSELPTASIKGLEIFQVGKWNGDVYEVKDLDDMVASFGNVGFHPFVKAGHQPSQESRHVARSLFGAPALGYVERLYRVGNKLLADIKDIPRRFADLIKAGAYRRVSAEIYFDYNTPSGSFRRVLKCIAFLGAEIPALTDLKAVEELYQRSNIKLVTFNFNQPASERSYQMEHQDFNELFERSQRIGVDAEAADAVDQAVKQRMSETKETYSVALYSLRHEAKARQYSSDGPIGRPKGNIPRRYESGVQLDARAKELMLSKSVGYSQALRIAMMESPDSARDYSGHEVSRDYASKMGITALANICSHCTNDDMLMDWDQALEACSQQPEVCQNAASERIVQLTDRMIALEGIPGSEVNAGGREEMRRRVLDQYPALAATALDGSAMTVDALRQILWTKK